MCPLKDMIHTKRQSTSGVLCSMFIKKFVHTKTIYTLTHIGVDMLRIQEISLT